MSKRMRKTRLASFGLACSLACAMTWAGGVSGLGPCGVSRVLAAEQPEGMDTLTWWFLQDSLLGYEEIPNRIQYFNPSYQQLLNALESNYEASSDAAEDLREEAKEMNRQAVEYKKQGDMMGEMMYQTMTAAAKQVRSTAKTMDKVETIVNSRASSQKNMLLKQLTKVMEQLYVSYHQVSSSSELLDQAAALSEAALRSAETQKTLGMASEQDVLSARQSLLSVQNQKQSLEDNLDLLLKQICLLGGWDYDEPLELSIVPAPDLTRVASMDPKTDITEAAERNYEIYSQKTLSVRSSAEREQKERTLQEMNYRLNIRLEALYQAAVNSQAAYEAAQTAAEAASLSYETVRRQYELGMIGELQFRQAEMARVQQEVSLENASLALFQAISEYDWAMKGIVDLE